MNSREEILERMDAAADELARVSLRASFRMRFWTQSARLDIDPRIAEQSTLLYALAVASKGQ